MLKTCCPAGMIKPELSRCLLPQVIKKQLAEGVTRRRVGFISSGAPARQHSEIVTKEGKVIGEVTSGGFSPCLKKNIAMG